MDAVPSQLLRDLAANIRKSPLTLADLCLRDELVEGPDLIALMATRGVMNYQQALASICALLDGELSEDAAADLFDVAGLSALARLKAGRPGPGRDYREAAQIAQAVRRIRRGASLPYDADRIEAQTNLKAGYFDHIERHLQDFEVDDVARWMVRTELIHPDDGKHGSPFDPWLDSFNDLFGDHGLLPLAIAPGPSAPFDRITVDVPDEMRESGPDCPLVTIIMSTFKPDQSLRTAVGSLINQTWQNLEILLVDDCSPPEFDGLLHEAAAMDPRIRLIRMEQNGGTYKIRNFAISVASGEFIAFKDSDDWSHPERIERQVRPLLESAELVGTTCSSIRVNANLGVSSVGFSPARQCASSPVFRRRLVMDTLGGFDSVRKAGDTEFTRRIELVFGVDAFPEVTHPLVLTQLTPGSLSRAEFGFGWHHGARVLHREAYRYWHRVIGRGLASPFLDPAGPRPFVSPDRLKRSGAAQPEHCDVLMISDWGDLVDRYVGVPQEVLALADAGLSTRIAQSQSIRYGYRDRHPPSDEILELQERGKTRFALWDEDLHARILLVRDPEILNFTRPANKVKFRADRLVIVAGYPCRTPEDGWLTYDPSAVERHARQMFGVEPEWLPGHDGIAESLLAEGAEATILSPQHVGVVETSRRPFSGVRGGRRPVVGTTGLKAPMKDRPTMDAMRQMFPDDDDYDVRISADRGLIDKIRRDEQLPVNWLVLDEPDPSTFLRQLDFFVGVPKRSWGPELSWAALEAIAHGALAILDPAYEEQFGDAAVYVPAAEVKDAVDAFVKDPEEFARQQSRGYGFCDSQVSAAAFRKVVFGLGDFTRDNTKGTHS